MKQKTKSQSSTITINITMLLYDNFSYRSNVNVFIFESFLSIILVCFVKIKTRKIAKNVYYNLKKNYRLNMTR